MDHQSDKNNNQTKKKRSNLDRAISAILCLSVILCLIHIVYKKFGLSEKELSGRDVTEQLTNVVLNMKDTNGTYVIRDNILAAEAVLTYGSNYDLSVSWEISSEQINNINKGDYIVLDIGNGYFTYTDTKLDNELKYGDDKIGRWGIKDDKIQCVFTENIGRYLSSNGYIEVTGIFNSKAVGTQDMTLAGIDIKAVDCNPEVSGFPVSYYETLGYDNPIIKRGATATGAKTIQWDILVNAKYEADYYYDKMNHVMSMGNASLDSVLLKDELPDDLVVSSLAMDVWLYRPKSATELTGILTARVDITDQFTEVAQKEGQSEEDWITELQTYGKAYGLSTDQKTIYLWVETLSDLKIAENNDAFEELLVNHSAYKLTTDEREALKNIYGEAGEYPVKGFDIMVMSEARSGEFEKDGYKNTAYLMKDGKETGYDSELITVGSIKKEVITTVPKMVRLIAKDYNTGQAISGSEFKLQYHNGTDWSDYSVGGSVVTKTTNADGEVTFTDLLPGTYRFVEISAKEGYDITSAAYSESPFEIVAGDTVGKEITVTNKVIDKSITVRKIWEDYHNTAGVRPESVTIRLNADGVEYTNAVLTSADRATSTDGLQEDTIWEYTFTDLPVYSDSNPSEPIDYTLTEDAVENYVQSIENYTVTDTLNLAHSVKLIKTDYNTGEKLDDAQFKLQYYSAGYWLDYTVDGSVVIKTTDMNGEIEFTGLTEGRYRFVEVSAKEGYSAESVTYSVNPFDILPTDTDVKMVAATNQVLDKDIKVTKVWSDNNNLANMRPTMITLILMDGSLEVRRAILSKENATNDPNIWEYIFRDLPVYYKNTSRIIDYTVSEEPVDNYEASIDGYTITNTFKITHSVKLTNIDDETGASIEGAEFKLQYSGVNGWEDYQADGAVVKKQTDAEGVLEFKGLAEGTYRFVETAAKPGYDLTSALYSESTFVISATDAATRQITVTHKTSKKNIRVTKVWKDFDNTYNLRPASVTIKLMNGNDEVRTATLTAANSVGDGNVWEYTFTDIPEYDVTTGIPINYTVKENEADKYSQSIEGFTVTDLLELTHSVKLRKLDYETGEKLAGVKFKLQYLGGTEWTDFKSDGMTVEKQTDADGALEFTDLPAGTYRFVETMAKEGYDINTAEYSENEFVILSTDKLAKNITATNKRIDKNITIKKIWSDYNNAAGVRPDSVTIRLKNGDKDVRTVQLTADNAVKLSNGSVDLNVWEYTFTDVPVYDNATNTVISHTVAEDDIAYYHQSINGYTITNTLHLTHSVRLTVLDYNTKEAIDGAEFKLQVLNGAGWEDYTLDGSIVTKMTQTDGKLEFAGLPAGTYRLEELSAKDGYHIDSAQYSENSFVISPTDTTVKEISVTNKRVNRDITVKKIWKDNDNAANVRPGSITIRLMNGTTEVRNATLTAANAVKGEDGKLSTNEWEYTFANLPVYNESTGSYMNYTVTEDRVADYERYIDGYTITNIVNIIHSVRLTDTDYNTGAAIDGAKFKLQYLSGKEWLDYKENGVVVVKTTDSEGKLAFYDIPAGTYRFVETAAKEGYHIESVVYSEDTFVISPNDARVLEIRATNMVEDVSITITKKWVDDNNSSHMRPAIIKVMLFDEDTQVASAELSEYNAVGGSEDVWEYILGDLPVYYGSTNRMIRYILREEAVEGYLQSVEGYTITGTLKSKTSEEANVISDAISDDVQSYLSDNGSQGNKDEEENDINNVSDIAGISISIKANTNTNEGLLSYTEYLNSLEEEPLNESGKSQLIKVASEEKPAKMSLSDAKTKTGDTVLGSILLILVFVFGGEVVYGIINRKKEQE